VNMGAPLLTIGPRTRLRQAYRHIATVLAGDGEETRPVAEREAGDGSKKGLFSFLGSSK
jgi:hypothetical protein